MKLEHMILASGGFLIMVILALVFAQPDDIPSWVHLEQINSQALFARDEGDDEALEKHRSLMQQGLEAVASKALDVRVAAYVDMDYNFPFRSVSEINARYKHLEGIEICDMISKVPAHLHKIRDTEMFSMFRDKYRNYPMTLEIQDERHYISTIHYSLVVRSGNNTASTFFHLSSCTDQIEVPYNLSCRDSDGSMMHTRYKNEVVASLQDDAFCEIHFEPWRKKLADYTKMLSEEHKKNHEGLVAMQRNNFDPELFTGFVKEMERLQMLEGIAHAAMEGDDGRERLHEMMAEYEDKFGSAPEDFLLLLGEQK